MLELECHDIGLAFFWSVSFKGELCSKHSVEGDAKAPDIDEFGIIALPSEDFRSSVGGRSTDGPSKFPHTRQATKPKVDEFHVPVFIEENVFRLYIAVAQPTLLEVEKSR